jgi:transposase-like protein
MLNAITAKFGRTPRQRCVMHKMDNVLSYIPTKQQEQLKPELRALFYQKDRQAPAQAVAADHSRNTRRSIPVRSNGCLATWRPV